MTSLSNAVGSGRKWEGFSKSLEALSFELLEQGKLGDQVKEGDEKRMRKGGLNQINTAFLHG